MCLNPITPGRSAVSPSLIDLIHLLLTDKGIGLIQRLPQRGANALAPGRIQDCPWLAALVAATAFAPLGGLNPRRWLAGQMGSFSSRSAPRSPGRALCSLEVAAAGVRRRFGHAHRPWLLIGGDGSAILNESGLGPTR